ncbi:MAG: hypothetical protein ABIQ01_13495 [Pseudolysinimonas sp.]
MFEIGFGVEVDPEFPADGGEPPQRIPPALPRIGAVLRLSPRGAPSWDIAIGAPNWWRTPIPTAVAFISDWTGYVVDVVERRVLVEVPGAARGREDERHDLLLLCTEGVLVAVGAGGVAWRSEEIAYDDLKVVAINDRGIVCTGYDGGELPSEYVVDPTSGQATRVSP